MLALLCMGKEVPRNPPALHAGPLRFLPRRKKLGKKGFAIWSLRGGFVIIPLLKAKFVDEYKWLDDKEALNLVAIAQSAPGVASSVDHVMPPQYL